MYFKKYFKCRTCFYILIVIASLTESIDSNNSNSTAVCKSPGCRAAVISNLKQALSENIDPNEPRTFKLTKNYYNACMDLYVKTINNKGLQPLLDIINDLGRWPMVVGNTWNESKFDWMRTLYKLRQYGYLDYILGIFVGVNENNKSKPIIEVRPEILTSGWSHPRLQSYHKYMFDVATLLGADPQIADWQVYETINFEAKLAYYADDSLVNEFVGSIANVAFNVPQIPWLDLINNLTFPVANFTMTDQVRIFKQVYLDDLPLISNISKRTVANYLIWRVIDDSAPYISNDIRKLYDNFNDINEPRHKHCLNLLMDDDVGIPVGVDAIYVKKYSNNDTRDDVQNIIQYIKGQMEFFINQLTWLDNQTRNGALEKVHRMENVVAYPDDFYDYTKMDMFSSKLDIDPNNHLQNFLNIQLFNYEKHIATINGFTGDFSFDTETAYTDVNAVYGPDRNRFKISAAMLQSPLYRADWPNYMKYGIVGDVIGHEMMHAFDNGSFRFDATGNLTQWYTNQSALEYENKMQCFVQHYEKYHIKRLNLTVNGSRTLNENLADYGGVVMGYTGYKKWIEKNGKELPLPGLNYTPEQIFWIMAASQDCSKSRRSHKEYMLLNEEHTLEKFRVFGMVSNSADFAKDFNCPVGSRMNPKKKCSLM
ncbi:hypothetical protein TSAR_013316 [Trichomalopsis sarcophagae]|uniref:Peptidase M13 C-terminal domain-containing protein n=1 Tax=Trichomalopsis sarcophagae TaxID=543379 RepID=A0A232EMB5_9HYME|nr:hypothetical protein TSAR_013316 [Trichomalopsis sarcophagae]